MALTGAGGTAATMVIEQTGAYASQTGISIEWDTMRNWTTATDLVAPDVAPTAKKSPPMDKSKSRGDEASVTSTRSSTRKTRGSKSTQSDYHHRILELSKEDDNDKVADDREDGSDTNDDVLFVQASVTLPNNMLPIPGFLVAALMQAYTSNGALKTLSSGYLGN